MKKYLLDTNICIYFLKGQYDLDKKLKRVGLDNCFVSEITLAELKFGAENSKRIVSNRKVIKAFSERIGLIPIFNALDLYAKEKARLRKLGTPLDDFDLLIGSTAIANGMVLVTKNTKHFMRLNSIKLEDWTKNKKA